MSEVRVHQVWMASSFSGKKYAIRVVTVREDLIQGYDIENGTFFSMEPNRKSKSGPYWENVLIADVDENAQSVRMVLPSYPKLSIEDALDVLKVLEPLREYRREQEWLVYKKVTNTVSIEGDRVVFVNVAGKSLAFTCPDRLTASQTRELIKHLEG